MRKLFFLLTVSFLSILNASPLRVSAQTLNQNLKGYKIIDVRKQDAYLKGHIPNALNLPVSYTYANKKIDGKLTDPFTMQKVVQKIGLHAHDKIVIYDDGSFFDAARLFWALEVFGFKNVKLLDAGYKQWKEKNLKTSTSLPKIVPSDYITTINTDRLATKFSTQVATKNPNQFIVDARPYKAYLGKVSSAKRYGHIPKALNIPAKHHIDTHTHISKIKDLQELAELYKEIPKDKKIILYCAIGKISATNYFVLRELGYNVANYDASWKEWGNSELPIIQPLKQK